VCAVCDITIWRHSHVSKPTYCGGLLTQYAHSSTRTLLILCVVALNINYQGCKLSYRRKIHSTLRHSSSSLQKYKAERWNRGVKHTHQYVRAFTTTIFALSRKLTSKKYAQTVNIFCAGNKVFVTYQSKGDVVNPKPPLAYALVHTVSYYLKKMFELDTVKSKVTHKVL